MRLPVRVFWLAVLACLPASMAGAGSPYVRTPLGPAAYAAQQPARRVAAAEAVMTPSPVPDAISDGDGMVGGGSGEYSPIWNESLDYYDGGPAGGCDSCPQACPDRCGMWYGSIDYLLMRPRFSQGVAELRRTLVTNDDVTPNTSTLTDQTVQFDFKYNSSFRAAIGYRLLDCGGDIQFAYWRLTGESEPVFDGPANASTNNPFIIGQLKNIVGDGQFFYATAGVTANIFDIDFAKCLSLGGPQGGCDPCGCPRWDLRFSAGVRAADISRYDNNIVRDADGNNVSFANIDARFSGAGPRIGMQGRRYFGQCGAVSAYGKASQGLLLGDFRMSRVKTVPSDDNEVPTSITQQFDSFHRIIPVTDIEIGGSWQVMPYTFVSVGWFFQAWWDLGQAEDIGASNFGPLDSANILGFDGLFLRAEILF